MVEKEKVEISSLAELIEKTVSNVEKQNDKVQEHVKKLGRMQAEFLLELGKLLKKVEIDAKQEIKDLERQVNTFKVVFIVSQVIWFIFFVVLLVIIIFKS